MKKLLLILSFFPLLSYAQYKREDIFRKAPLIWLGIDFSRVRVEGYDYSGDQFKEVFFPDWNELVRNRTDAVNVNKFLHRDKVEISIDEVNKINSEITRNLRTVASVDKDTLSEVVKGYNLPQKNGVGVILFVSDIIHKGEHLYGKIVFVDLKTKDVLMVKKFQGNGRGFGFRNTWANAIRSALGFIRRKWNNWEKQVNQADKIAHTE